MSPPAINHLALIERHLQGRQGEAGLQVIVQRPAGHLAAEGVDHHRQIDESLVQTHIGDVGHPQLVGRGRDQAARQVGPDRPAVARVRRRRPEGRAPEA